LKEPVICDSACLIALERIDRLDLLPALFDPVQIPPAVGEEFGSRFNWLSVEPPSDRALVAALGMLVDSGEAEALALACERDWTIVLDDKQARSVGKRLGLRIIGTVALIIRAKKQGLVPAIAPLLESLAEHGFRVSEALRKEALDMAGE
jgi:predicted nucleic acid-binding protein